MATDYQQLKKGGFMRQIQKDRFSLRLHIVGGQITSPQIAKVSEIAERFGHGYIHMTSRQGIEIPFIAIQDIDAVKKELADVGLSPGACGPRVRTVTACQGSAICPSGLIDTSTLAKELDARYFGRELPHKFKIGITGCKNNCLKAEENDLGIKGGILPAWTVELCTYCGVCEAVCPPGAIRVDKEKETLTLDANKCDWCGRCIKSCPMEAWKGRTGFIVTLGGMFGNRIRPGQSLLPILFEKEKLFAVADTALRFFEENGRPGERFALTIERAGREKLEIELMEELK